MNLSDLQNKKNVTDSLYSNLTSKVLTHYFGSLNTKIQHFEFIIGQHGYKDGTLN